MNSEVVIPSMGESISEVHIGQILAPSGKHVNEGDELVEIETEKVNQILYAPKAGKIDWRVKTGDAVSIGTAIATIQAGEGREAAPPPSQPEPPAVQPAQAAQPAQPTPPTDAPPPSARRDASDFLQNIETEPPQPKTAPPPPPSRAPFLPKEERKKMSPIRKAISERLIKAKSETASITTFNEIDMSKVIEYREKYQELFKKKHGVKLGFLSFFVKATIMALREFPVVGSMIEGTEIVKKEPLDIGIAISTDRGLIVPVLRNGEKLSFAEIEKCIEELAKKARGGGLSVDEIRGGVFTITNGGLFGSLLSTPILNFPQSAILGLHKIDKRPKVVGDQIVIRPMMYAALTYDHRLIDGKEAVLFLVRIKEYIEDPERMLIEI